VGILLLRKQGTLALKYKDWLLLCLVLLAVLAVRLPFILGPVLGGDAAYHARAAQTVLNSGLLYRDVPYTYPPLYAYTEALALRAFEDTNLGWKTTAQFYDLASIVLIYLTVNRFLGKNKALFATALYGISPLPLVATSVFACFDSTAAFWMLASLLLLLMKKPLPSAVALGIGVAYKYFPLILLPVALVFLSTNRQRIKYALASLGIFGLIQLPFVILTFEAWLDNVFLFHLNRPASGASIYNLLTLQPSLLDVQSPLAILSPIALLLAFLLVALNKDRASEIGLLRNSAFLMVAAVFFNKVVLFYALWFIPLLCVLFAVLQQKRAVVLPLVLFFILQTALLLSWYLYDAGNMQGAIPLAYVYLAAQGLVLRWLLRDRLKRRIKADSILFQV
jgi:uncharacterized membrane protein